MTRSSTTAQRSSLHLGAVGLSSLVVSLAVSWAASAVGGTFETSARLEAHVLRGRSQCADLFVPPDEMTTARLVKFQADLMNEQRAFSAEFTASRMKAAYEVWRTSDYIYTLQTNGDLASTYGLTFSDYHRGSERFDLLPEESTLGKPLDRPLSANGSGFIVEGRVYGMLREHRAEAYPAMLKKLLQLLQPRLEQMPDLYDQKIIHTYGDEDSIRLYGMMGFENYEPDQPIEAYGQKFWRLRASPRTVERQVETVGNLLHLSGFDQPLTFKAGSNRRALKLAAKAEAKFKNRQGNRHTISHFSALAEPTELAMGIVSAPGSAGALWKDQVIHVEKLAQNHELGNGMTAEAGSSLAFHPDSGLLHIDRLQEDHLVWKGVWARAGSRLEFSYDRKRIYVFETAKDAFDSDGRTVLAGSAMMVSFDPEGAWQFDPHAHQSDDLQRATSEPFSADYDPKAITRLDMEKLSACHKRAVESVLIQARVHVAAEKLIEIVANSARLNAEHGFLVQTTASFREQDGRGKPWVMDVTSNYAVPIHEEGGDCRLGSPKLLIY